MAEWIVGNEPPMDLWHMDIRRFGSSYESPAFTMDRVQENYEQYYDIHYPLEERLTGRPAKTSPVYEWHKSHGAVFGEKASWERVNYYDTHIGDEENRPYGWAGKNWSAAVQVEHAITRTSAGIFDESSFAKLRITGARAGEFLNLVCANNVVRGINRTVYTQALNTKGGIESDYTVTQIAEDEFLIITGTAFGNHDGGWLRKQRREMDFADVEITDSTSELAVFGIWGPKAREILQSLTPYDLGNENFPFMHSRELDIAGVALRATRITYVGELGWELYLPVGQGAQVWDALIKAGKPFGAEPCGYRAIESLRLEKGYLAWGSEINTETTPLEAGLGFAVSQKKSAFIGKAALLANPHPSRALVAITFDDLKRTPLGNEPIRVNGEIIGRIKSGGQGYTLQKGIGYAYLPSKFTAPGTSLEVEFFGEWQIGVIRTSPLFDPEGLRIKA